MSVFDYATCADRAKLTVLARDTAPELDADGCPPKSIYGTYVKKDSSEESVSLFEEEGSSYLVAEYIIIVHPTDNDVMGIVESEVSDDAIVEMARACALYHGFRKEPLFLSTFERLEIIMVAIARKHVFCALYVIRKEIHGSNAEDIARLIMEAENAGLIDVVNALAIVQSEREEEKEADEGEGEDEDEEEGDIPSSRMKMKGKKKEMKQKQIQMQQMEKKKPSRASSRGGRKRAAVPSPSRRIASPPAPPSASSAAAAISSSLAVSLAPAPAPPPPSGFGGGGGGGGGPLAPSGGVPPAEREALPEPEPESAPVALEPLEAPSASADISGALRMQRDDDVFADEDEDEDDYGDAGEWEMEKAVPDESDADRGGAVLASADLFDDDSEAVEDLDVDMKMAIELGDMRSEDRGEAFMEAKVKKKRKVKKKDVRSGKAKAAMKEAEVASKKKKKAKIKVDNVFADLENCFNGLSASLVWAQPVLWSNAQRDRPSSYMARLGWFLVRDWLLWVLVYFWVSGVAIFVVIPAVFVVLLMRAHIVERKVEQFQQRQDVLASETTKQKTLRLVALLSRALPMFTLLVVWPCVSVLYIIPTHGKQEGTNLQSTVNSTVGLHIAAILILQMLGTFRSIVSFRGRKEARLLKAAQAKAAALRANNENEADENGLEVRVDVKADEDEEEERGENRMYHGASNFRWMNVHNWIAIFTLLVELFQMGMFSMQAIYEDADAVNREKEAWLEAAFSVNGTVSEVLNPDPERFGAVGRFFSTMYLNAHQIMESNKHLYYTLMSVTATGLLVAAFVVQLLGELRRFGFLKAAGRRQEASDSFFYSFVGSIVYGHGDVRNVSGHIVAVVKLLSDTLFLVIVNNMLLMVTCLYGDGKDSGQAVLIIRPEMICWEDDHRSLALLCLIAFSFYVPLSTMIAPLLVEQESDELPGGAGDVLAGPIVDGLQTHLMDGVQDAVNDRTEDDDEKGKKTIEKEEKRADVGYVKPFLSVVTVGKSVMIIVGTFFGAMDALWIVLSQLLFCAGLGLVTFFWWQSHQRASFARRKGACKSSDASDQCGMVGSPEPCYPPEVNIWKCAIYTTGFLGGCVALLAHEISNFVIPSDGDTKFYVVMAVASAVVVITVIHTIMRRRPN